MARKKKEQLDAEQAAGAQAEPTVEVEDAVELVDRETKLVEQPKPKPRPKPEPPPTVEVPPPKRYRVKNGGRIMHGRTLTHLKRDKVVDGRCYNLDQLRQQGIELEPLSE